MTNTAYRNENHRYVNPRAYDLRKKQPLERYLESLWRPIITSAAKQYINDTDIVCDFGCGTLAYISSMQTAQKIYAIDTNNDMVTFGLAKLSPALREKTVPVIRDATSTALPHNTCSIVWSIGLTEYVSLPALFQEMTRVSKQKATMLLQFPNKYHPVHIGILFINLLRNKKTKRYRTLQEIQSLAQHYGWQIEQTQRTGFYLPVPYTLIPYCAPLWQRLNWIGNNVLVVLRKANPG